MPAKIWVRETIDSLEIEGALETLVYFLTKTKDEHPAHTNFQIDSEGDYPEDIHYIITAERLENDREFERRMKKLKKEKEAKKKKEEAKEEDERKEYLRLKRKFGDLRDQYPSQEDVIDQGT
jgi:hypothetical protein